MAYSQRIANWQSQWIGEFSCYTPMAGLSYSVLKWLFSSLVYSKGIPGGCDGGAYKRAFEDAW